MNNFNRTLTYLVLAIVATLLVIVSLNVGQQRQLQDMRNVYTICQTQSIEDCQQAQDLTSTEYLCNKECWVEVK